MKTENQISEVNKSEKVNCGLLGRIQSFQSLGTVDGPGVRYVVFMQGCNLRCVYCHNPETWDKKGDSNTFTTDEVVTQVLKYRAYIKKGGVTVTGGEPLLQIDFVTELFKKLKEYGIHTAVDTSGYCNLEKCEELFKYTDLVICDLKFNNDENYRKYTGVPMQGVLDFLKVTEKFNVPVNIRQVIVPNINDTLENAVELKKICNGFSNIEKIDLLPFRKLCLEKYEQMGLEFKLKDTPEMSGEKTSEFMELIKDI